MESQEAKFRFEGLLFFLDRYKQELISKKCVALFSDYEKAKEQIIYSMCDNQSNFEPSDLFELINGIEQIADINEFFNEL